MIVNAMCVRVRFALLALVTCVTVSRANCHGVSFRVEKLRVDAFPRQRNPFAIGSSSQKIRNSTKIVCYLTGSPADWLQRGVGSSVLHPDQIPDGACDVVNLLGWVRVNAKERTLEWKGDVFNWQAALRTVLQLKARSTNQMKIMVTIGNEPDAKGELSDLVVEPSHRKALLEFSANSTAFLLYSGLDGLDIDWEYPGWKKPWQQRPGFLTLVRALHSEFSRPPWTGRLKLSVAVAAVEGIIDAAYAMPQMAQHVDWVNLMAYDYHGFKWYLPFTGHNAPLLPRSDEQGSFRKLNVAWSVERWLELGMPAEKLYLGIPTYGRNYRLLMPEVHDLGAVATAGGWVDYADACALLRSPEGHGVWDYEARVPYVYKGTDWISYDDVRSIKEKMDLIAKYHLGGAMVFSLDADDFQGKCDENTKFPLLNAVREALK